MKLFKFDSLSPEGYLKNIKAWLVVALSSLTLAAIVGIVTSSFYLYHLGFAITFALTGALLLYTIFLGIGVGLRYPDDRGRIAKNALFVIVVSMAAIYLSLFIGGQLGHKRVSSPDGRRIADVRQLQNQLELRYADPSGYPASITCTDGRTGFAKNEESDTCYTDPDGKSYYYEPLPKNGPPFTEYALGACLQDEHNDNTDGNTDMGNCPTEMRNAGCTTDFAFCVVTDTFDAESNSSLSENDVSNWKVYESEEYGFEFQYPEDWEYVDNMEAVVSPNKDQHGFEAIFQAGVGPPIQGAASDSRQEQETTVSGQKAIRTNYFKDGVLSMSHISFSDVEPASLDINMYHSDIEDDSAILEKILSSFEIEK